MLGAVTTSSGVLCPCQQTLVHHPSTLPPAADSYTQRQLAQSQQYGHSNHKANARSLSFAFRQQLYPTMLHYSIFLCCAEPMLCVQVVVLLFSISDVLSLLLPCSTWMLHTQLPVGHSIPPRAAKQSNSSRARPPDPPADRL